MKEPKSGVSLIILGNLLYLVYIFLQEMKKVHLLPLVVGY